MDGLFGEIAVADGSGRRSRPSTSSDSGCMAVRRAPESRNRVHASFLLGHHRCVLLMTEEENSAQIVDEMRHRIMFGVQKSNTLDAKAR
jgi:hypothetical protein